MSSPVLQAEALSKRYGRRVALSDCTLAIPPGHVVGLVGPNGAGKTTLLHIAVGLLAPTAGSIAVLGGHPASGAAQLAKVGFVAQDAPTYAGLSIADHLRFGAHTNPGWDQQVADDRITKLGLDPSQKAGKLSGGQTCPTCADHRHREATGAAHPRRARSQPRPTRKAGVPARPDGVHRRT
jgi:ABC-2 type transport system ATP-binding protein